MYYLNYLSSPVYYTKNVINPLLSIAPLLYNLGSQFETTQKIVEPARKIIEYSTKVLKITKYLSYLDYYKIFYITNSEEKTTFEVDNTRSIEDPNLPVELGYSQFIEDPNVPVELDYINERLKSVIFLVFSNQNSKNGEISSKILIDKLKNYKGDVEYNSEIDIKTFLDILKGNGKIELFTLNNSDQKINGKYFRVYSRILLDSILLFTNSYILKLVEKDPINTNKAIAKFLSDTMIPTIYLLKTISNPFQDIFTFLNIVSSFYTIAQLIKNAYLELPLIKNIEKLKNILLDSKNEDEIAKMIDFINQGRNFDMDDLISKINIATEENLIIVNAKKRELEIELSKLQIGTKEYEETKKNLEEILDFINDCEKIISQKLDKKLKYILGNELVNILKSINEVRILKKEGKIDEKLEDGIYPIEKALLSGNIDAIKYLVANGANLELDSTLVKGVKLKDLYEVIVNVETKLNDLSNKDEKEKLLSVIIENANIENSRIVKEYLEKKYPELINEINKEFEDLEKLEKRIKSWEKLDAKNHTNETLMDIAIKSKRLDYIEYLLFKDSKLTDIERKKLYYNTQNSQLKILQKASKLCKDEEFKKKLDKLEAKYTTKKRFLFF